MPNSWFYDVENLALVGGMFLLIVICRALIINGISMVIRWRRRARAEEEALAEQDHRGDELRIERSIFWPGYIIGIFSWTSTCFFDFDPLSTLALNTFVAYFSWYALNQLYAWKFVRKVKRGDLDEGVAIQTIERDMTHIAWGRAMVAGVAIGAALVHGSFGVVGTLVSKHLSEVTLINLVWGIGLLPLLVVWGKLAK